MHFDGKMKNNRRKIERGLGILPYGNSTTQTIGKCGGFRLCHDTGSACYGCFRHYRRVCRYFNVGEKRWWVFFLNDKNRIQYNDQCKKCVYECKQSFRCRIVWCGKYYSKRRKRQCLIYLIFLKGVEIKYWFNRFIRFKKK